jgi:hypothetical protein
LPDDEEIPGRRNGRVAPEPITWHLPIAGEVTYRYGPDDVAFDNGRFATERTFVSFDGTTGLGRALAAAVPRRQQRLAGKRSGARGHHLRLRRADAAGGVRRTRHRSTASCSGRSAIRASKGGSLVSR